MTGQALPGAAGARGAASGGPGASALSARATPAPPGAGSFVVRAGRAGLVLHAD
jgi:hypothetical protein